MIAAIHKIREFTTYLVAVYFLFPVLWASYLIGLWGLFCILSAIVRFKQISTIDWRNTALYSIPFIVLMVSVIFHGGHGGSIIEKSLSFLVFPICVFLTTLKISKQELKKLTWIFVAACCILALRGIGMYWLVTPYYQYDWQHDFIFRYRAEFNTNTKIAPTYASIYFAFALLLVLLQIPEIKKKRGILFILSIFIFLNMILLSAKMPILSFGLIFLLLLLKKQLLFKLDNVKRWLIVVSVVILSSCLLFTFTRWNELFTGLKYQTNDVKENSVGVRKGILKCAMELSGEYYLLGVGPQHVQKKLNQCYYQFEGNDFDRHEFNTHNQYFDFLLSSGIIGLGTLLFVLLIPLYNSIKQRDPILFSFIVLIAVCMLTENILSRQAGIVFYAFFNAILVNRKRGEEASNLP